MGVTLLVMRPQNPPSDHHYIPAFYLRRWSNKVDKKVIQFTKDPMSRIVCTPRIAQNTGYETGLYSLKGYPSELAQQVEKNFFAPLDENASEALRMLEQHGHLANWNEDSRTAWTRFLLSLLLRCPADIKALGDYYQNQVFGNPGPIAEEKYRTSRGPDHPETFAEYLKDAPKSLKARSQFEGLCTLITDQKQVTEINQMEWRVLQSPVSAHSFLISDRPVIRSASLSGQGAHIALPIGPRLLFIASPDSTFLTSVLHSDQVKLVKTTNRHIVEGAQRFVWSCDESQRRFIENHFGKKPQAWLLKDILGKQLDISGESKHFHDRK